MHGRMLCRMEFRVIVLQLLLLKFKRGFHGTNWWLILEIEYQFNWIEFEMHSDIECHILVQGATTNN